MSSTVPTVQEFLSIKTPAALELYHHFINSFQQIGNVHLRPTKSMIGIANDDRRIAWITAIGKNFVHVVFPFQKPYNDNLCFQKIAQVPGDAKQFNHHFRMYAKEDINDEVKSFMKFAFDGE
jgi:hypothetical protein